MAKSSKVYSRTTSSQRGCLVVFGGIFVLVGAGLFTGITIIPLKRVFAAREWVETPCVIISSEIEIESSDDGSTYSPNIHYSYAFGEADYESGRYNFASGSTGDRDYHQAVVDRFPPGTAAVCFVNPVVPEEAVLSRDIERDYFYGLLGMPFALAGLVVIVVALRSAKSATRKGEPELPIAPSIPADRGPITVRAGQGPLARFIGIILLAAIWNGITWTILYNMSSEGSQVESIVPYIFITPFLLIGLGIIGACFYFLLAVFNPRPTITITPGTVRLGGALDIKWTFSGATHRIKSLNISLKGVEQARYTRGTSTYTDKHTFAQINIFETANQRDIRIGRAQFTVPEYTMHSFDGGNNQILWSIKLTGAIDNWPDVAETFDLQILPLESGKPS